jgi:hypothetical protein
MRLLSSQKKSGGSGGTGARHTPHAAPHHPSSSSSSQSSDQSTSGGQHSPLGPSSDCGLTDIHYGSGRSELMKDIEETKKTASILTEVLAALKKNPLADGAVDKIISTVNAMHQTHDRVATLQRELAALAGPPSRSRSTPLLANHYEDEDDDGEHDLTLSSSSSSSSTAAQPSRSSSAPSSSTSNPPSSAASAATPSRSQSLVPSTSYTGSSASSTPGSHMDVDNQHSADVV